MELGGVGENEVAVVGVGEDAFFDQAMALEQDCGDVGHVPMADVGGEDRLQARAHRIAACVEGAKQRVGIEGVWIGEHDRGAGAIEGRQAAERHLLAHVG